MYLVGLTGGIGSGKSTVAAELVALGAQLVDADAVAREVVAVGEPALNAVRERFGPEVIAADGTLDRAAVAAIVFDDEAARRDLESITHPAIGRRIEQRLATLSRMPESTVVVVDHPLLVEAGGAEHYPAVIVVAAPADVRVARLAEHRGMDADDARARIAAQTGDEQRRAVATHVIDNAGDRDALRRRVAQVWTDIEARAEEGGRGTDGEGV